MVPWIQSQTKEEHSGFEYSVDLSDQEENSIFRNSRLIVKFDQRKIFVILESNVCYL